jgi:two-component system sensor histidine kinase KdpD
MRLRRLFSGRFGAYVLALGLVIVTTGISELIARIAIVDPTNMDMLYILGIVISAAYLGFGPSLMLSFLSVLTFDFLFLPPLFTFAVSNQQEAINLLILFLVCIIISFLSPKIRQ